MRRINYREDFLLRIAVSDCEGQRLEQWPAYDFAGVISSAGGGTPHRFGRRGGSLYGCTVDPDDGGVLLVAVDSHSLRPGRLRVSIEMAVPDAMMPDGTRRVVISSADDCAGGGGSCRSLDMEGVELVWGASDCADSAVIEVTAPFIVRTAYDMARQMGYDGSQADYEAALAALPAVAQTSAAVAQMAVDVAVGRRRVIDQINARGITALAADASLDDVASAIRSARLAVEGEPGLVMPAACGLPAYDLLNEVRNRQLADYPYCSAIRLSYRDVLLEGADAYLCSDGFFCETPPSGEGVEHTFDHWGEHFIIYYYRSPNYAFQPDDNAASGMRDGSHTHQEWLIYSGAEVTLNGRSRNLVGEFRACHGGDLVVGTSLGVNVTAVSMDIAMVSGVALLNGAALLRNACVGGEKTKNVILDGCNGVYYAVLPDLKEITGGKVASTCTNLRMLSLPELEVQRGGTILYSSGATKQNIKELLLPSLTECSGYVVYEESADSMMELTQLSLPSLKRLYGSAIVDRQCPKLTDIDMPELEVIEDSARICFSNSWTQCTKKVNCPKLKRITSAQADSNHGVFRSNSSLKIELNVPQLEYIASYLFLQGGRSNIINLGAQQEAERLYIAYSDNNSANLSNNVVTVQPGFRSSLNISRFGCTAESLSALIANLADNNGHATLTLTLGSANISRLSAEDIAVAQAKNYTIA